MFDIIRHKLKQRLLIIIYLNIILSLIIIIILFGLILFTTETLKFMSIWGKLWYVVFLLPPLQIIIDIIVLVILRNQISTKQKVIIIGTMAMPLLSIFLYLSIVTWFRVIS